MAESLTLYKPALYAQSPEGVVLLGGRCACGHVFFPMQTFGCERCGQYGDALTANSLKGRGTLIASVLVHLHADKKRPVPFVIGTIRLDDGPVIRTLLTEAPPSTVGNVRVVATLAALQTDDTSEKFDLRFAPLHGPSV